MKNPSRNIKSKSLPQTGEKLIQQLFDSVPDAIYFKDRRGRLIMVNKAHAAGLKLKPKNVIGKTDFDFFPEELAGRFTRDDRKVMKTGVPVVDLFERTVRPDGSQHCVSTTKIPRKDKNGKIIGIMGITRDITERTKIEEDRYRLLFETSQNCIFITTKDGQWLDINDAGVKLFGYGSKEEILKTKVINIYADPKERQLYTKKIEAEKFVKDFELDFKKKDGATIHTLVTAVVRKDKEGKILGYQGTILDITARKHAEEEKERLLHSLIARVRELDCFYGIEEVRRKEHLTIAETLREIVYHIPPSWQYPEVAACRIVIDKASFATRNFKRTKWMQRAAITVHGKKGGFAEVCYLRKRPTEDEGPFTKEERGLVEAVAKRIGLIVEHKRVQEALQKSLKETKDIKFALDESSIVAITDQKGRITYINDNFCRISKYSRKELIGKNHGIVNSGFHSREFMKNLWGAINQGKVWKGEMKNKAKDNTFYWVDTTIVPFLNEQKKPYQFVAIHNEITQRRQMEEALKKLPQQIIQAQESERNRISREIHDDLGQSLVILKMLIQSAFKERTGKDEKFKNSYDEIIACLNTVIEKSRHLASGLRPATLEILGLSTAIHSLIDDFRRNQELRIQTKYCSLEGLSFYGEMINLYRIIQEALTNVVKHAQASQAEVTIERNVDKLHIAVRDDGKGFNPFKKDHDQNFERGIGLSTMKERTQLLKGDFRIYSQPGKGTTVTFDIPIKRARKIS